MSRISEELLRAALCVVAIELGYSLSKNMTPESLTRALRNKLPGHGSLARELLRELVRKGYLTTHGGRQTYMLTRRGRGSAGRGLKPRRGAPTAALTGPGSRIGGQGTGGSRSP